MTRDVTNGTTNWSQTSARSVAGYGASKGRIYRTPSSGNALWLASTIIDNGSFDDLSRMTFAYASQGRLIWQKNGAMLIDANYVTFLNRKKCVRISSGNYVTGRGGTIEAKWAMVRPHTYPEPDVSIMDKIAVVYNSVDSLVVAIVSECGSDVGLDWTDSEALYYCVFRSATLDSVELFQRPFDVTTANHYLLADELISGDEKMFYSVAAVHADPLTKKLKTSDQPPSDGINPIYSLPAEKPRPIQKTP